jgi:hypothetical protein
LKLLPERRSTDRLRNRWSRTTTDDIKEYKKEASKKDAAGQLAQETLPTLQHHLKAAQSLEKQTAQKQSSR